MSDTAISRRAAIVVPVLIVAFAAALYIPRRDTPIYLAPDEVFSALTAHSIATTGHDLNGRLLPVYFQLTDLFSTRMWYQPTMIYAIAGTLKLLPFSESTVRLPMALAGVLDVALAYFVALALFRRQVIAAAAAILLALTPAHFADTRVAMDFHAFLPFILGWLLCLATYVEQRKPYLLFAAGLVLGAGLFTYIGAYALMPAFACLTALVLYRRDEPWSRIGLLAAGFALPALLAVFYVATHPTVIADTLWRYERNAPQTSGGLTLFRSFLGGERPLAIAAVYASFWQPRLLFVNGPQFLWLAGQFVLPMAGLFVATALRMLRRMDPLLGVLLAGLALAPIPASFVGEPGVIRRAAGVMPFAVLLAAAGLAYIWDADSARAKRMTFVALWASTIAVAILYYADVPRAQALIRASTVPLVLAGLAAALATAEFDRLSAARTFAIALVVLVAVHGVYVMANRSVEVATLLAAGLAVATLLPEPPRLLRSPAAGVALVAFVTAHFMFLYVDYGQLTHVGPIPAAVVLLSARLIVGAMALAAVLAVVRLIPGPASQRMSGWRLSTLAAAGLIAIQCAYFSIDYFTAIGWRALHVGVVIASVVALAVVIRGGTTARVELGPLAAAGVLTVAAMHFAPFRADYFAGFHARGAAPPFAVGPVFEEAIQRTRDHAPPAIYLAWRDPLAPLYWRFYLIKHHREDLLERTVTDVGVREDRLRSLPPGSLVIATTSGGAATLSFVEPAAR